METPRVTIKVEYPNGTITERVFNRPIRIEWNLKYSEWPLANIHTFYVEGLALNTEVLFHEDEGVSNVSHDS